MNEWLQIIISVFKKHISTKWEGPVQFLLSLNVAQSVKD